MQVGVDFIMAVWHGHVAAITLLQFSRNLTSILDSQLKHRVPFHIYLQLKEIAL